VRVFENRVLRKILQPKRGEITGKWRRLHIEELDDFLRGTKYYLVIKSRRMRWAGHVACMGDERCRQGLGGETLGKNPLGRPSHRWEDNIKVDLQEVGWGCMN
jgi:hypothetical protein